MKIKEIITRVDKSPQFEDKIFISEMAEEMGLDYGDYDYSEQNRLTSFYIGSWICTDTEVGYKVYFFDDEPVAVSSQNARKSDEEIEWLSKEAFNKVREYVLTFKVENEPVISLCDPDEEIGDTYKIHYHGQLHGYQKDIPLYKGVNVKIVEFNKGHTHTKTGYEPSLVLIEYDGTRKWLEIKELDFPYNLK